MRIAFVKYAGLAAGGTERWLQEAAVSATALGQEVDYFYCEPSLDPLFGMAHAPNDISRMEFLKVHGVNLIEFRVGLRDLGTRTMKWRDTDFFELFDSRNYDWVQTAKSGAAEFPFVEMDTPFVQTSTLIDYPDNSSSLRWTFHLSSWAMQRSVQRGANLDQMSVAPIPVRVCEGAGDLREQLGLPPDTIALGLHQRADDGIFSEWPLEAYRNLSHPNVAFLMMGGSDRYRQQAKEMGLKQVFFLPHQGNSEAISSFLNTLDIFVHGRSDGETFGAVIAEALSHGVPCITHASQGGANGHRETLGPGGYFTLSMSEYSARLDQLVNEPETRQLLSSRGRRHANRFFSVESFQNLVLAGLETSGLISSSVGRRAGSLQEQSSTHSSTYFAEMSTGYLQAGDVHQHGHIIRYAFSELRPEDFDTYLAGFFLRKAKVFVDVGANAGLYTPFAASQWDGLRIHAFEPLNSARRDLLTTVELNGWEERVTVWPMALSDRRGSGVLYEAGTGSTLRPEFNDGMFLEETEVELGTLDDWVRENQIEQIDFIKIDVEGHELSVLTGSKDVLLGARPVLFIELAETIKGRSFFNNEARETVEILQAFEYQLYVSDGKRSLKPLEIENLHRHLAMVLAVPAEMVSAIETDIETWIEQFPRRSRLWELRRRAARVQRAKLAPLRAFIGSSIRTLAYRVKRLRAARQGN